MATKRSSYHKLDAHTVPVSKTRIVSQHDGISSSNTVYMTSQPACSLTSYGRPTPRSEIASEDEFIVF